MATGLSTAICKDGQTTATAIIPFAEGLSCAKLINISGAAAGQVKFPATQNASSDANTLDDYQEYTAASTACSGALTTAIVWKATKEGNVVTLTLPSIIGTCSAATAIILGVVLPADFRPIQALKFPSSIRNNATNLDTPGAVFVDTDGTIYVSRTIEGGTNFTNAASGGLIYGIGCSWTV